MRPHRMAFWGTGGSADKGQVVVSQGRMDETECSWQVQWVCRARELGMGWGEGKKKGEEEKEKPQQVVLADWASQAWARG